MNAWFTAAATAALIVPLGVLGTAATRTAAATPIAQDTAGKAIFMGKGLCHVCHGPNAKGTPLAPDLTDATWLHIDGKLESIVKLVKEGVPSPKNAPAPMPARGGAQLTDAEVQAVSAYVHSLSAKPSGS